MQKERKFGKYAGRSWWGLRYITNRFLDIEGE